MKSMPFYSMALSLAIHLPLLYGFQASFFGNGADALKPKTETAIFYKTERSVQRTEVIKADPPAPREGFQSEFKEQFPAVERSSSVPESGAELSEVAQLPASYHRQVPKKRSKTKVARKVFVPTVENINLENAEKKRIFFGYYDIIRKKIKEHTVYPYQAKVGVLEGDSYISFVLKRNGKISKIVLLESSGFTLLDDAAMNSIRNAEPFPPFPANLAGDDVKLNVPISFRLD